MTEWGLWDEARECWVRRGYGTAREAAVARTEIERRMAEDDDTNLQIHRCEPTTSLDAVDPIAAV